MNQTIRRIWPFLIISIILFIVHFHAIYLNDSLMIFNTDSYSQSLQFYLGGWEKFRSLDFSFWDWSSGYGANIFDYAYYFITSPFFYLTLFFNKEMIPYLIMYLNILKLFLLFTFSFFWIAQLCKEKWIITIGSLIITFSGWVTFLYHYNIFLDGFILYPLILFSIELFYKNRNIIFSLFIGLLGIINYYMLYMFIPFVIVYSVLRFFTIKKIYKYFITDMFSLFILGLLGIGISSFIILPSLDIILNMPRISNDINIPLILDKYQIFRFISTVFTPTVVWNNPTYFITFDTNTAIGWGGGTSIFSFYLFPFLLPHLFFIKDSKAKWTIILTYIFLIILSLFPYVYRLFQGTVDVRWFYMFVFINVYTIVHVLKDISENGINTNRLTITTILNILFLFTLYFVSSKYSLSDVNQIEFLSYIILIGIVFMSLYFVCFLFHIEKLLVLIICLESIVSFSLPLYTYPPIQSNTFYEKFDHDLGNIKALDFIQSIDEGFYRIIRDNSSGYNYNEPFANQYMGITFYNSLYNFETTDFFSRFSNNWLVSYVHGRFNTTYITSVKYYIQENKTSSVPYGFNYFMTIDESNIYVNQYYIPLGYSSNHLINADFFKSLDVTTQDQLWLNNIVTNKTNNTDYSMEITRSFVGSTGDDGYLEITDIQNINDSVLTIENRGTPYMTINLNYEEETFIEYHYQYDYFQMYIPNNEDLNSLQLNVSNPYGNTMNVDVYSTKNLNEYDQWYENLNVFQHINFEGDDISADISINKDNEWVATSIPYNEGWTVTANGKEIDIENVNLGFIGFNLSKGDYHITFHYFPTYLKQGLIISTFSLFTYLLTVMIYHRKKVKIQ